MKKKLKKLLIIAGIVLSSILALLVISFLFLYFNTSFVKNYLEKSIAKRGGTRLTIGELDYGLFPLTIQAGSVEVFQEIGGMEVSVSFDDLKLDGYLGRLLWKKRPFLQSIGVEGMTCRIHIKEVEEEMEIDYQMYMRQLSDALSYLQELNLENFSVQYITPTSSAMLHKCRFKISESEKEGEYIYSLHSEKLEMNSPSQQLVLETAFRTSGRFSFLEIFGFEADMVLTPSKCEFKEAVLPLPEVALKIKSEFPPDKKTMSFPRLELSIPSLLDASASLNLDMGEHSSLESSTRIHVLDLQKTFSLLEPYLKPYIPAQLESFEVDGAVLIEGEYTSAATPLEAKTDLKARVLLEPTQIRCETSAFHLDSSVSGEIRTSGLLPDMKLAGSLNITEGALSHDDLSIQEIMLALSFEGTSVSADVSRLQGSLAGLTYRSGDRKIDLDEVRFDGLGSFDINRKKIRLDRLEFHVPPLAPVEMSAFADLQPKGEKSIRIKSAQLDSAELIKLFSPFIPESVQLLEPMGLFDFDVKVNQSLENEEIWDILGTVSLAGGGFHNASFTFASESLQQKVVFNGKYNVSRQLMEFTADVELSQGESLLNAYYMDWSQSPFRMTMSGVYHIPLQKLDDFKAETSLFSEGKINVGGWMTFQEASILDLQVTATKLDLGSLFVFASQGQPIEEFALDLGGVAEAQVRLRMEDNALALNGRVWIKDGSVRNEEKNIQIDGIQVNIPFSYENPAGKSDAEDGALEDGFLSIEKFETPSLSFEPFRLDLHAAKNRFETEPLTLDIFGGQATLGKCVLTIDPEIPSINGLLSFSLAGLDLSQLPVQSDQFSLRGTVLIDLPRVELNPDEILTQGKAELKMFDTTILVEDIRATKPFTKNRTIYCNIKFDDLNLEQLTNTIPFGRVTGILKGEVKDLTISYGQPESFILSLESVKTKGVPQKFSLGAVNDLSIISSGESSAIASNKGFTKFISDFGYQKIGIFCSLKNDSFSLRGTIREKGVEYLVKRSWLFGISVVNKKPKNRIRFKDMMSRLERIGQSEGATTRKKDL